MAGEVEKSLLGSALTSPETAHYVASKLDVSDFYNPHHASVFTAIVDAITNGDPTDAVSIGAKVGDRIGGPATLFDMVQAAQPGTLEWQVKTVKAAGTKRRLAQAGARIQALADSEDADYALSEAHSVLNGVASAEQSEAHLVGETLDGTLERIRQTQEGTAPKGLMTGFNRLDGLTNGFRPGQMVIVAARPGVGKSTIGVDFMRHLSIVERVPTLMFSLEMSQDEINERILAAESGVTLTDIRAGRLGAEAWQRIEKAKGVIENAPMHVDATPETTIVDIIAKTKMMVARYGVRLVVIDYLQLLSSGGRRAESRQQEVSQWSRQIKLLSKSAGIPIITVAQLNRGPENRDGGKPKPSDLRESGALEQDADIILLLHRDEIRNPDSEKAGEVEVIVGKNRGGRTGEFSLANQLHYGKFGEL